MNKNVILFTHHYVDDFIKWNYENVKSLNPEWDVIPIGFEGYSLLSNSLTVNKQKYPTNYNLLEHSYNRSTDWSDPDLFLYDGWNQIPHYDGYFLYEYDTVCNVPVNSFFDTTMDFFGNNVNNPAPEDWYWVELYRKYNIHNKNFPILYGYGQSTCIFLKNHIVKNCFIEITRNKHLYCDMLSEIRGGTLTKMYTEIKPSREDIREFVWWGKCGLTLGKKEYFYHPIKNFEELKTI